MGFRIVVFGYKLYQQLVLLACPGVSVFVHVFNSKKGYLIALFKYRSAVLFGHLVIAGLEFKP